MQATGQDEPRVYLDGEIKPASEARIPVGDRAVLYGDSAFETLRAYGGMPFRLSRHLDRLEDTARVLRLSIPLTREQLSDAVLELLAENELAGGGCPDARVRITVTGGPSDGPKGLERPGRAGVLVTAVPLEGYPSRYYAEGVDLAVSGIRRNASSPVSSIKSGNHLDSLLARQDALDRGADDAVMLTAAGNLSEATSSNIFMVKDGCVATPDVGCGLLPGVTREAVIELCGRLGIACRPVTEGPGVLFTCDEAFLTNSVAGIVPVRTVGDHALPGGSPGPVTARLARAYADLVEEETGARP